MRSSPRQGARGYYPHQLLTLLITFGLLIPFIPATHAAVELHPRDFAVELRADVAAVRPRITLHWRGDQYARNYVVNRKARSERTWTQIGTAAGHDTWFIDQNVTPGVGYEYQVVKEGTLQYMGYGYIYAAINFPVVDDRGRVILLVESSVAEALTPELDRLEFDLLGDGWRVIRRTVARTAKPPEVKEMIQSIYAQDPANTRALFLFGNIPVPYSGDLTPDQHDNHKGAWPTDTYYGDLDGDWTDTSVTSLGAERSWNHNVPGDGKFDQSKPPSGLELQVGRVDLSRMTCFINKLPPRNEIDLLRQYLDKNHRFRHAQMQIQQRALVYDRIGMSKPEPLSSMAWRNFAPFVGQNIEESRWGHFIPATATNSYLWSSAVAGGGFSNSDGLGTSDVFALNTVNAVFMMFSGSYYGDWDNESNFLRAALGASGSVLVSVYAGQPQWICHSMALGETIGMAAKMTQENDENGIYIPHNGGAGMVHVNLHGDPTLRAHPVAPPANVKGVELNGSLFLSWDSTTATSFEGYFVYQSPAPDGPYARITPEPLQATTYLADQGAGKYFIVKTAAITKAGSGTYWNTSQGAFYPEPLSDVPRAPSSPRNLVASDVKSDAITLTWLSTSLNHTGFELERLAPGSDGFEKIAAVSRDTLTYRDASLPLAGTYGYRVRAINSVGPSDYSSPVFPSTEPASAEFIGFDTITRGAWKGVYGSDGYAIPEAAEVLPFNTALTASNAFSGKMAVPQDDLRALELPESTNRIGHHWVHRYPFALNLSFSDSAIHQVALYTMDYKRDDSSFEIALHDAVSGQLLDQRRVPNINEGVYALYNIRRQVYIRILPPSNYETNIAIYGLFFDVPKIQPVRIEPAGGAFAGKALVRLSSITPNVDIRYTLDGSDPTAESPKYTEPFWLYSSAEVRAQAFKDGFPPSPVAQAQFQNSIHNRVAFLAWDESSKGTWTFQFGKEGFWVPRGVKALPAYAQVTLTPDTTWLWSDDVTDDRAPFRDAAARERIAAAWFAPEVLELDLAVFDTRRRAIALYFLDWDNRGRRQVVELLDGEGAVVDSFNVEEFTNGKYLVLALKGYTKVRIRKLAGENAVLNGVFFDRAPPEVNAGTPVPLSSPTIANGLLHLTASGFEHQHFCLDASTDLAIWSCLQTNFLSAEPLRLELPFDPATPVRFHKAHIVP